MRRRRATATPTTMPTIAPVESFFGLFPLDGDGDGDGIEQGSSGVGLRAVTNDAVQLQAEVDKSHPGWFFLWWILVMKSINACLSDVGSALDRSVENPVTTQMKKRESHRHRHRRVPRYRMRRAGSRMRSLWTFAVRIVSWKLKLWEEMSKKKNPVVYFDISIDGDRAERLAMEMPARRRWKKQGTLLYNI